MGATSTPVEQTYEDVRLMVYKIVHRVRRRYGGEFDELLQEAAVHLMHAYHSYNPDKARFTTWAYIRVWKGLIMALRQDRAKKRKSKGQRVNLELIPDRAHSFFSVTIFLSELDNDAKLVCRLVLQPNRTIKEALPQYRKITPTRLKSQVKSYLKELGWSAARIKKAFSEVGEVLSRQ